MIVLAGPVPVRDDGAVLVSDKTLTGMQAYVERWPGPVRMVGSGVSTDPSGNLGSRWIDPDRLPFGLELSNDPVTATLANRAPGVVLAGLDPANSALLPGNKPVVLLAENTPANQTAYTLLGSNARPLGTRARVEAGSLRRHLRQRAMVRSAAGLQCNGWPTWDLYAHRSPNAMLYLDSRVSREHLALAPGPADPGAMLRVAFSGRWLATKGAGTVLDVARECERRGLPVTLELIGSGPLEAELRREAPSNVRFTGPLAFEPNWTRHVGEHVDVMLLPHPQADPSGTYLEALACGAPVVTYDNVYARRLVAESGAGWTVPVGDVSALTDRLSELASDPVGLALARQKGLDFMARHLFEDEFARRVEHALAVAQG